MYIEIKTDNPAELVKAFEQVINEGQQAMLTLGKDVDFWSLSINTISRDSAPSCSETRAL